eukprot:1158929-Pelagomonas_calceolata.AAC.5
MPYKAGPCAHMATAVNLSVIAGNEEATGASAVTITPYNAGHLLGGCVWRIVAGYADGRGGGQAGSGSEEEVVYAVDWCHKKER